MNEIETEMEREGDRKERRRKKEEEEERTLLSISCL